MHDADREALILAYLDDIASGLEVRDDTFWAWEELDQLIRSSPEEAWQIVVELVRRATTRWALTAIGTGPLETLLVQHGDEVLSAVAEEARREPKMAFALSLSDVRGGSADVIDRVQVIVAELHGGE